MGEDAGGKCSFVYASVNAYTVVCARRGVWGPSAWQLRIAWPHGSAIVWVFFCVFRWGKAFGWIPLHIGFIVCYASRDNLAAVWTFSFCYALECGIRFGAGCLHPLALDPKGTQRSHRLAWPWVGQQRERRCRWAAQSRELDFDQTHDPHPSTTEL